MTELVTQNGKAEEAFQVEQRIKQRESMLRLIWIEQAEDLYHLVNGKLYLDLGYASVKEWCDQPDVNMKQAWVYMLCKIWREIVVAGHATADEIAPVDSSKLANVLTAIRRGTVSPAQALLDARELSRSDLQLRYGGGGQVGEIEGPEPVDPPAHYGYVCSACGSWVAPK